MGLMKWNDALDIGVAAMNGEHKKILEGMNSLHVLIDNGAARSQILEALNSLIEIASDHFASEEEYMRSIRFPSIDSHQAAHKDLLAKLDQYREDYDVNGKDLGDEFFKFLMFWLLTHINTVDRKYADFSRGSGGNWGGSSE